MWSALGDELINRTAQWEPEPRTRGTWSIISSCLITLSLCVWTALHLNLPEHHKTKSHKLMKVAWLLIGLLAPEIVAIVAYRQWSEQRLLMKKMEDALGDRNPPPAKDSSWYSKLLRFLRLKKTPHVEYISMGSDSSKRRQYRWTHTHSFLAVMGGFAFDNSHARDKIPFPDGRQRLVLTTSGLAVLAELQPDMIPDISEDQIRDKSKTNVLAKTMTLIQALWFCAQVLTRMGEGLAVTLLELNTFAHALCALAIFMIWWNKPLDVEEPFLINVQSHDEAKLCAFFCNGIRGGIFRCYIDDETSDEKGARKPYRSRGIEIWANIRVKHKDLMKHDAQLAIPQTITTMHFGDLHSCIYPSRFCPRTSSSSITDTLLSLFVMEEPPNMEKISIDVDPGYFVRAELVREAVKRPDLVDPGEMSLTCTRAANWLFPHVDNGSEGDAFLPCLGWLAIAGCGYGAWHLTAWEGPFRGHTETLLWRGSAIGVGASGMVLYLFAVIIDVIDGDTRLSTVLIGCFCFSFPLLTLFMMACRLGLVVESFIGILYLPESAYQLPSWPAYFPHIG